MISNNSALHRAMVEELTRQKEAEERHELRNCVRMES